MRCARTLLPLTAAAALALAACGGDDDSEPGGDDTTIATQPESSPVPGGSGGDTPTSDATASSGAGEDGDVGTPTGDTTGDSSMSSGPSMTGDTAATADTSATTGSAPGESGTIDGGGPQTFTAPLTEDGADGTAFTYDPVQAPPSAELEVTIETVDDSTIYELRATGLQPDRGYAVHAHVDPCGATGDAAGPHFQFEVDPAATPDAPSSDPAYANPDNEVWLELMTDAAGDGTATTTVPFTFEREAPMSIVVHADEMTMTEPGMAGMAGDRIACLDTALR